jgi:hypothetical protein
MLLFWFVSIFANYNPTFPKLLTKIILGFYLYTTDRENLIPKGRIRNRNTRGKKLSENSESDQGNTGEQ